MLAINLGRYSNSKILQTFIMFQKLKFNWVISLQKQIEGKLSSTSGRAFIAYFLTVQKYLWGRGGGLVAPTIRQQASLTPDFVVWAHRLVCDCRIWKKKIPSWCLSPNFFCLLVLFVIYMRKTETSMHSEVMVNLFQAFGWWLFCFENSYNNSRLGSY